jgi:hypothetical protein
MRKKTLLILLPLAWVCLTSCAVTLKNYKPANPEEAAIISVIIAFEESFNKVDQKRLLSILADEAQIMYGREKKIATKEEFARILPERFRDIGTIAYSNPKIKIDGDITTVQIELGSKFGSFPHSLKLKKIGGKWLILASSY